MILEPGREIHLRRPLEVRFGMILEPGVARAGERGGRIENLPAGATDSNADEGTSQSDADVVDAEFEEVKDDEKK